MFTIMFLYKLPLHYIILFANIHISISLCLFLDVLNMLIHQYVNACSSVYEWKSVCVCVCVCVCLVVRVSAHAH